MENFLETRSMNLNVRVSPAMKLELTERAKRVGLNLTDFIYVAIAKSESMDSDVEVANAEKLKLQQQVKELQTRLSQYETVIAPLANQLVGTTVIDEKGNRHLVKDCIHVVELVFSNFQKHIK